MKFDKKVTVITLVCLSFLGLSVLPDSQAQTKDPPKGQENEAVRSGVADKFGTSEGEAAPPEEKPAAETEEGTQAAEDELVYLNATDVDIKDLIKQISKATGTNFLIEDKIRGKITIISEKPMTPEMAYQAFLSALEVMGYTPVKTPGGLLKIVQTKEAITKPIDLYTDETPYTDKFITRIIQVKNISANDLSTVVKSLVSKEGNLFAYPQTNSLIVTDTGSNIDRILRIIKELDQEGPQEVIEIIPILHADAANITEKILQLFEQQFQEKAPRRGARRRRAKRGAPELEEAPSISKVISDERTNSVIILGSKRSIVKIRALISRLDSAIEGVEGAIHVYYLKHANAKEMADVLSNLVSGQQKGKGKAAAARKGAKARKGAAARRAPTGAVQLEGGVKVTADEGTNSLVITASPKDFQILVEQVIRKLDIPRRQVYLEAVVMELTVDKSRTLGLSGSFGRIFNFGGEQLTGFASLLPIFPTTIGSIAGASGGVGAGGFSERTIEFEVGGEKITLPAVSAIIQALQTDSDVNVLSTPSILTLDNEEAKIQIGQEVPVRGGRTVTTTGETFEITREDTGIILTVTPQISESDTVRLKLAQEISNVGQFTEDGPVFTKRIVETVVVANDKQTIVIGGLIDDQQRVTTSKVPLLGDIPIVGNLFKNRTVSKTKTNIIVFITPYIIRERADYLEILRKKIEERNLFIDLNYGHGQRKQIRKSIRLHARDLLEYRTAVHGGITTQGSAPVDDSAPHVVDDSPKRSKSSNKHRRDKPRRSPTSPPSTQSSTPTSTTTTSTTSTEPSSTTSETTSTTTTESSSSPAEAGKSEEKK